MADELMYIPNDDKEISSSVDYNYWLKYLNTKLNESTNQYSIKVPKVFKRSLGPWHYKPNIW